MVRTLCLAIAFLTLVGCNGKKPPELKSPCVSAESSQPDHPCVKRPVNAGWLS